MLKISVIIPIYNVEKYIRQCLESIINQSYRNLEIIIVNDGTKDNSMNIVGEYLSDERIKVINKENGGISSARNRGIEVATGDYIHFVDSDDWIDRSLYENLVKNIKDEDILVFNFKIYDEKIKKYRKDSLRVNLKKVEDGENIFYRDFNGECWNKLYKKSYIDKIKVSFIEDIIYEDISWGIETISQTFQIKYIDIEGYFYRINRIGSIVATIPIPKAKKDCKIICNHLKNFIEKSNLIGEKLIRVSIEKEKMRSYGEGRIEFKNLDKIIKENYLKIEKEINRKVVLKEIEEVLRYKKTKGIKIFDWFYWKNGIYNFSIVNRIIKNRLKK